METNNAVSLDFLLEPVKPAGKVTLLGVEYELMRADLMENFLILMAMVEHLKSEFTLTETRAGENPESASNEVQKIADKMEEIRVSLRRMIRILLPGMSEDLIAEHFPKLEQLQALFSRLLMEVQNGLPESVKKNSESEAITAATAGTEAAKA